MASHHALLLSGAIASTACSLVYDTSGLRGHAGGEGTGGEVGTSTSTSAGGAGTGGAGGSGCECEPRADIVWLVLAEDAATGDPAPACPRGRILADGGLSGTLEDEGSRCGGSCTGPSKVKVSVDDTCGVGGEGVDNTGACDAKSLTPENPGDTTLAINLEPQPCTLAEPALVDMATVTRASACSIIEDDCAPPAGTRRCVPATKGSCDEPCFGEPAALQTIVETRVCDGVLATCSPAVVGQLELHDDAACDGTATASWPVSNMAVCPTGPTPPLGPTESYWRFLPDAQACDAMGQPTGSVALADTVLELCCAATGD
jgi:hypothetical protein